VGFEPTVDLKAHNGFQGRRIQPLCHPSGAHPIVGPPPNREVVLLEGERIAFGATVRNGGFMLDLADGRDTERTRLKMVRSKPVPFPPEPLRWAGITLTRRALAKADRREGRRGPWLRMLDRLGMGFDS
jgi:hypothetical protein